jgi:hypothetical protein
MYIIYIYIYIYTYARKAEIDNFNTLVETFSQHLSINANPNVGTVKKIRNI